LDMTGSEAVVASLKSHGVKVVFGLLGSGLLDIVDVMNDADIRFVGVRHESGASMMADAYARMTLSPAVCMAGEGAGATNLLTGVAVAFKGHSPVVAITAAVESDKLGSDAHQELDQCAIFRPVTKASVRVDRPERIPQILHEAFTLANRGRKGPVHVDIPRDFQHVVLDSKLLSSLPATSSSRGIPAGLADEIARRLSSANRPVIIAGGGVVWSDAVHELVEFAEILDVPVVTSRGHNDAFPSDHRLAVGALGLYGSKAAMLTTSKSDVIIALGTKLGEVTTSPYYGFKVISEKAAVIQIDIDQTELGKRIAVETGVASDAKAALKSLISAAKSLGIAERDGRWVAEVESLKMSWASELEQARKPETKKVDPAMLYDELRRLMPKDSVVVLDAGILSQGFAYISLDFNRPRSLISPVGIANVGFCLPEALGAKIASEGRPVIGIVGDGAFSMVINEVMTAVQEKIPVVMIVMDNSAWGTEKWYQTNVYGRLTGSELTNPDFAKVSRQMGCYAARVERIIDFEEAFTQALREDRPSVIDVVVDPEIMVKAARAGAIERPRRMYFTRKD
jgi:sulfoacetaldehyde acetyltransferase